MVGREHAEFHLHDLRNAARRGRPSALEVWPRKRDGSLGMYTGRLDLSGLLKEVEAETNVPNVEAG